MLPGADTVLVRYGEIGTKSPKVRTDMERRLRDNLEAMLEDRGVRGTVERQWSRLFVRTDQPGPATDAAVDTFGVVSASACVSCEPTLDAITAALANAAETHPVADGQPASFAVRANRAGNPEDHAFTSVDIEREGGAVVGEATGAPVDLDDPDRTYYVECRKSEAFVFTEKRSGPGGLPLGTQGRAVVLVSGGIDSPVAAYEMMRRGVEVLPVYVDLGAYGGPDHRARAQAVVGDLARYAPTRDMRLRLVDAGDLVETLVAEVEETRMLSLRRAMLAIGAEIAERENAHSVVTGESLGQKSSQTATNLAVTDAAVQCPVHRPLLTWDKTDIMENARAIGTYDESTIRVGCERVAPSPPETHATLAQVEAAEPDDLLERAAAAATDDVERLDATGAPETT